MINRKNYLTIGLLMLTLLFLLQFTVILKDVTNEYNENEYLQESTLFGSGKWTAQTVDVTDPHQRDYVLYVGGQNEKMLGVVREWATYAKLDLLICPSVTDYPQESVVVPKLILLESETGGMGADADRLMELGKQGSILVFGSVGQTSNVISDKGLRRLLGIRRVYEEKIELNGYKLYSGLLLGGEMHYEPEEDIREKDENLVLPWYQLGSGTKVYIEGIVKDEDGKYKEMTGENLPVLLWRNRTREVTVFGICGNFLEDKTGLGILSGIVSESNSYDIYPVVNAQNLSVVAFPHLANENAAVMQELYSRPMRQIMKDILWPSLIAIAEDSGLRMSCFLQTQTDETDDQLPIAGELQFYLKQLKEQKSEAGLSFAMKEMTSLESKLTEDENFLREDGIRYRYGAVWATGKRLEEVLSLSGKSSLLVDVTTIATEGKEEAPILCYGSNAVTIQGTTSDAMTNEVGEQLRLRSIETCLGYSNVLLNLQDIFWPTKAEQNWSYMGKEAAIHLHDQAKLFSGYAKTTISESDRCVRTFLNLDYTQDRVEDTVILHTSQTDSWFVLRTHGEEIDEVSGATWEEMEEGIYLLHVEDSEVKIRLKTEGLFFY